MAFGQSLDATVTAPFILDADGRAVVEAYLNDRGPFRLIVDTGATATVLAPEPAAALGLLPTHEAPLYGIAGVSQAPVAQLASLGVGGGRWEAVDVALLGGRVLSGADGLLGMGLWRDRRVTLDFVTLELRLEPTASRRARSRLTRAAGDRLHGTLFLTPVRIGAVRARALVDTGATHTLLNPALAAAFQPIATPGQDVRTSTAGASAVVQPVALPLMEVGDLRVRRMVAFEASLDVFDLWAARDEPALVLGMDVWRTTLALSIDYPRAELQLLLDDPEYRAITRMEATRIPDDL